MASPDSGHHPFQWHYGELDDKNFGIHGRGSILLVVVVFAILIFLTLLCLYAKWVCRYRRRRVGAASLQDPAASSPAEATLAAVGLGRDAIDSLPVHVLSAAAEEAQCPICLSNLAVGGTVKVLPVCDHAFHPECVDEWLKGRSSCPLCRASLAVVGPPARLASSA